MKHTLVLFDIDGTLLYSKDTSHRKRFEVAIQEVYGISVTIDWEQFHGHIDTSIFVSTLTQAGVPTSNIYEKLPLAFEQSYEYFKQNIPKAFHESILPGARDLLEHLAPKAHLGILSGNYEKTGWHKLELVGLRHYFTFGVFGHEGDDRIALARLAPEKAKRHFGKSFQPNDIYIIGDTPKDIACAKAINARSIAVTTGHYSPTDLLPHTPDLLVHSLEDSRILPYILSE